MNQPSEGTAIYDRAGTVWVDPVTHETYWPLPPQPNWTYEEFVNQYERK